MSKYVKYAEAAQDQYDFFNNGKRKGLTVADYEKKRLQAVQEEEKRWRAGGSTAIAHSIGVPEKPSKYKANL